MTTTIRREVSQRTAQTARKKRRTFAGELFAALASELEAVRQIRFPSDRYRHDPVGFCREVLGVEPWRRQCDVLNAVLHHDRVAVKSGRRVSKSHTIAALALWWYCSWPDARVILTSTTARQVDSILWLELSKLRARAGRCVDCVAKDPDGRRIPAPCPHSARIDGELGRLARTGLKSDDFREIVGFTARESEAMQGIAGARLMFLIDEASGIPQAIYEAIEGNRAGGAKIALFGNPTKTSGEFYEAFTTKRLDPVKRDDIGYFNITISSEESPNVVAGRELVPGLAGREFIREREREWGRSSALFQVHVLGQFAEREEGRIFSIAAIAEAQARIETAPEAGILHIGLDPAGASGTGDESVFAARRGLRQLALEGHRGLDGQDLLQSLLELIARLRHPRERPVVVIDAEGPIGGHLVGLLQHYSEAHGAFDVVAVMASRPAMRQPHIYSRVRDELTANLESWLRDGGAVLEDNRLADEMHAPVWEMQVNGRYRVTRKDDLRKELGRSPDRYDATALSVWEAAALRPDSRDDYDDDDNDGTISPFGGSISPFEDRRRR